MIIYAEFPTGTDIKDAAREACAFAKRNDCSVYFEFNKFEFVATPTKSDVDIIIAYYQGLLK